MGSRFRRAAEDLVRAWKQHSRHTSAHILEIDLWARAEEKRYFAVFDPKSSNRLWSLLVAHPVPGNQGFHLCHLMRHPEAPKGTNYIVPASEVNRPKSEIKLQQKEIKTLGKPGEQEKPAAKPERVAPPKTTERAVETPKVKPTEKVIQKPNEVKPAERAIETPKVKPREKELEKPKELRSSEKDLEK